MKTQRSVYSKFFSPVLAAAVILSAAACGPPQDPKMASFMPETESVPETTAEETSAEEKEAETTETEAEIIITEDRFFGRKTAPGLADINRRNSLDPDTMLVDILKEKEYTAGEILEMIDSYGFPAKAWYGNEPDVERVRAEISAYENREPLIEADPDSEAEIHYGILVNNSSLRSFPTELRAHEKNDPAVMDYFQESMLPYAEGVIILHQTADYMWSFVQGNNYFGWIRSQDIAYCAREDFVDYLTQDSFLVRTAVVPEMTAPVNRLGVIIPYIEKNEDGTSYTVLLPERGENGALVLEEQVFSGDDLHERFSDGFLPYSDEGIVELARKLLDTPYGWGDLQCKYDCSSFAGLLYRCFGVWLPRNSLPMRLAAGMHVEDVTAMEDSEKTQLLLDHPGAVICMPGHIMVSAGSVLTENGIFAGIIHCNTAYFSEPDGRAENRVTTEKVVETIAERTFTEDGTSFLEKAESVIWLEINND